MLRSLLFCLLTVPVCASSVRFASGENRTHLIELYSSEGCSSCPPAETWLGGLRDDPGLWRDFVPVAFHVDYWNHLGWRDRFAREEYTARQYAYSRQWGGNSVYTPGFVLDGAEWRPALGHIPPATAKEHAGILTVEYFGDGRCQVSFGQTGDYEACAVLLGGGISSAVRAGENEGRKLRHEFVVLARKEAPLHEGRAEFSLPRPVVEGVLRWSLAVWVTRRGEEFTPLQSTGGWLD